VPIWKAERLAGLPTAPNAGRQPPGSNKLLGKTAAFLSHPAGGKNGAGVLPAGRPPLQQQLLKQVGELHGPAGAGFGRRLAMDCGAPHPADASSPRWLCCSPTLGGLSEQPDLEGGAEPGDAGAPLSLWRAKGPLRHRADFAPQPHGLVCQQGWAPEGDQVSGPGWARAWAWRSRVEDGAGAGQKQAVALQSAKGNLTGSPRSSLEENSASSSYRLGLGVW